MKFALAFVVTYSALAIGYQQESKTMVCMETDTNDYCQLKPRRYDIDDVGHADYFHSWVDVQGQGVANDYCRIVGNPPNLMLSCALAGTHGCSDRNYESVGPFDVGINNTWYMKDENNDQRDDYCRCWVPFGNKPAEVVCNAAGPIGFDSKTFSLLREPNCDKRQVRPEFGREYSIP